MIILGLTGSIGMGKTTAAATFKNLGVPVHDADAAVHELMNPDGGAVSTVAAAFPDTEKDGGIDRKKLGAIVFHDPSALKKLEAILHPMVGRRKKSFLAAMARRRKSVVVLDVPLLFETGGESYCDGAVVVSAPPFIQAARVLARPGMTRETFERILAQQTPDAEKRRRADFIVETGLGRYESLRTIRKILNTVDNWRARHWPPRACRR